MFSHEYSKSFRGFFIEQLCSCFWTIFSIRKELEKEGVGIAFALISLCHLQIQEPASTSGATRAFVFLAKFAEFYYHKRFETKIMKQLHGSSSPCKLCITGDIKIYQCHVIKRWWCYYLQWRSALWTSIKELFLLPKSDNISPFVTRDKEICQSHMSMM